MNPSQPTHPARPGGWRLANPRLTWAQAWTALRRADRDTYALWGYQSGAWLLLSGAEDAALLALALC